MSENNAQKYKIRLSGETILYVLGGGFAGGIAGGCLGMLVGSFLQLVLEELGIEGSGVSRLAEAVSKIGGIAGVIGGVFLVIEEDRRDNDEQQ